MQKTLKSEVNGQIALSFLKIGPTTDPKFLTILCLIMSCAVLRRYHLVLRWCTSCQHVLVKVSGTEVAIRHRSLDDWIAKLESQNLLKVVSCPAIKLFLARLCPSRLFVYILHCMEISKKTVLDDSTKEWCRKKHFADNRTFNKSSQLNTICLCLTWITCLLQWWKSSISGKM